jgi:hypothetical protein
MSSFEDLDNINVILFKLTNFYSNFKELKQDDDFFNDYKIEIINLIKSMDNQSYIMINISIKILSEDILKLLNKSYKIYDIISYLKILECLELKLDDFCKKLMIQSLTYNDMSINVNYRSKFIDFNFFIEDMIGKIDNIFSIYENILYYCEKLNYNGNIKIFKNNINDIKYIIENIDNLTDYFSRIKEDLECLMYYLERKDKTLYFWNIVKNDFFEIAYHPDLFKKIVLDEKEISFYN